MGRRPRGGEGSEDDLVRRDTQQQRHLLGHHVTHEGADLGLGAGTRLDGAAVDDDAAWHPPTTDDPLSPGRRRVGAFTLACFLLLFMPLPIRMA